MTEMLNEAYLKMLPRFNLETIKVGDFVIINVIKVAAGVSLPQGVESSTIYSSAAVQVTAVRGDELLVRVVEVLAGNRYFEIHNCSYVAGESVNLNPKEVYDGTIEIWPAKAVIPGM